MNSKTQIPSPPVPPMTFHARLASYSNPSPWKNLLVDSDGKWIRNNIIGGSPYISHDGSYMAKESTSLCLAGIIIFCQLLQHWLKASIAEFSNAASNYCGKHLGSEITLVILHAAAADVALFHPNAVLHCNSHGVSSHSNSLLTSLPEKQKQANLI